MRDIEIQEDKTQEQNDNPLAAFTVVLVMAMIMGIIFFIMLLLFPASVRTDQSLHDHLVVQNATIQAEVVSINQKYWYATVPRYAVEIVVKNDEFDVEGVISDGGSGMYGQPDIWNVKEGDIVDVVLRSWIIEETGEVHQQKIIGLAQR